MTKQAHCCCRDCTLTIEGDPTYFGICHCTNCQRRTGSAFGISAYFKLSQVSNISGIFSIYQLHEHDEEKRQSRYFCRRCGTTLYWELANKKEFVGIAGSCIEDYSAWQPTYSMNEVTAISWVSIHCSESSQSTA